MNLCKTFFPTDRLYIIICVHDFVEMNGEVLCGLSQQPTCFRKM